MRNAKLYHFPLLDGVLIRCPTPELIVKRDENYALAYDSGYGASSTGPIEFNKCNHKSGLGGESGADRQPPCG